MYVMFAFCKDYVTAVLFDTQMAEQRPVKNLSEVYSHIGLG